MPQQCCAHGSICMPKGTGVTSGNFCSPRPIDFRISIFRCLEFLKCVKSSSHNRLRFFFLCHLILNQMNYYLLSLLRNLIQLLKFMKAHLLKTLPPSAAVNKSLLHNYPFLFEMIEIHLYF